MAKLYDISADMVQEQGFLDALKELLSDSNPMVVANAVAALSEIGRDDFLNKGKKSFYRFNCKSPYYF